MYKYQTHVRFHYKEQTPVKMGVEVHGIYHDENEACE